MSCDLNVHERRSPAINFRSDPMEKCMFLTFGKQPAIFAPSRNDVIVRHMTSSIGVDASANCPDPRLTSASGAGSAGLKRERKGSTETGPPDPAAAAAHRQAMNGRNSSASNRTSTPTADDDDVFSSADYVIGSSSRSISVPPRLVVPSGRGCHAAVDPETAQTAMSTSAMARVSPPRMKRRKKKNAAEPEAETRKSRLGGTSGGTPSPLIVKRSPLMPHEVRDDSVDEVNGTNYTSLVAARRQAARCSSIIISTSAATPTTLPMDVDASDGSTTGNTRRKKNLRWKSDVTQSSPDVASDDADSKESGYITLEDLQAQLGRSSWSSDERQTDQEIGFSSGDEKRADRKQAKDGIDSRGVGTSTVVGSGRAICLSPLTPEPFEGDATECRSAPPTCDSSLLRFTFTVRLDSKMFRRRMNSNHNSGSGNPPRSTIGDVDSADPWQQRPALRLAGCGGVIRGDRSAVLAGKVDLVVGNAPPTATVSLPQSAICVPAAAAGQEKKAAVTSSATQSEAFDEVDRSFAPAPLALTAPPRLPPKRSDVPTPSPMAAAPFGGERMVVRAEVHRSAESDATPTSSNYVDAEKPADKHPLTAARSDHVTVPRRKEPMSAPTCRFAEDIICSPDGTDDRRPFAAADRARAEATMSRSCNGRIKHVDVDQIVEQTTGRQFDRQTSTISTKRGSPENLTLALKNSMTSRHAPCATMDSGLNHCCHQRPDKKSHRIGNELGGCTGKDRSQKPDVTFCRSSSRKPTASRERDGGLKQSESSSTSSDNADSESELCSPCLARDQTSWTGGDGGCRGCTNGVCGRRDDRRAIGDENCKPTSGSASTRRTLRQIFRVENLFACRNHTKQNCDKLCVPVKSDKKNANDDQRSRSHGLVGHRMPSDVVAVADEVMFHSYPSRSSRSSTRVGNFHHASTLSSSNARPDRRGRQRSSRRAASTAVGALTVGVTTSRSVSPQARSRCLKTKNQNHHQHRDATVGAGTGQSLQLQCHRVRGEDLGAATVDRIHRNDKEALDTPDWKSATMCVSPSDASCLSGSATARRRQTSRNTMAVTPISPTTPGGEDVHPLTLDRCSSTVSHSGIDFVKSLNQLQHCGWYWGALGFDEAELKLADKPDGTFLVRDSSDDRYILSLSFRSLGTTHHTRIEHYKGMFSFYSQPQSHSGATIVEFIDSAVAESRAGRCLYYLRPRAPGRTPAPVRLLHPLSRLHCMHSLKHLCKFAILRCVRLDMVDRLPVSPRLKEYLKVSGHGLLNGVSTDCSTLQLQQQRRTEGFHC